MHGKHFYEYAVIRVLPKVEREEFVNVGVILFSRSAKYIGMKYQLDKTYLRHSPTELDIDLLEKTLISFQKIAEGAAEGGKIASLDIAERFRWLTAVRSTCLQTSVPHNGFCEDPQKTLEKLFEEFVL